MNCKKCICYDAALMACMIQEKDRENFMVNGEKFSCMRENDRKYILVKNAAENYPTNWLMPSEPNTSSVFSFTMALPN